MVDKICECDHLEKDHKYMNMMPEELLTRFAQLGILNPEHSPDMAQPKGWRIVSNGAFWFHHDALKEMERQQTENSYCRKKHFFKGCKCRVFKADNLRYLEKLSEHKTS